jgi:hypothetical protein
MGKFIKILDYNYKEQAEMEINPESKLEYLGDTIFDFTTYDGAISVLLAENMLPVIKCILEKTTFVYISANTEQYVNYITMVNTGFLADKIEWGTSIRGAWFDNFGTTGDYEFDCGRVVVNGRDVTEFMRDLLDWVKV